MTQEQRPRYWRLDTIFDDPAVVVIVDAQDVQDLDNALDEHGSYLNTIFDT